MRISNLLHMTEHHRYAVYRDFALSALDYKLLNTVYQPMAGASALSLFHTLYGAVAADRIGYSAIDLQRGLFLQLDLEPNEQGKKIFIDQTSKLEAVGLLQTLRRYVASTDDYIYEYRLHRPLPPHEFFQNEHLVQLLRNKLGRFPFESLKEQLHCPVPEELSDPDLLAEDLTVPFYEVFQLNTGRTDPELAQAARQIAAGAALPKVVQPQEQLFRFEDIIRHFPKVHANRQHVENMQDKPEQMHVLNQIARMYNLSLKQTASLLDEDGIFASSGEIRLDTLKVRASRISRQDREEVAGREPRQAGRARAAAGTATNPRGRPGAKSQKPQVPFYTNPSTVKPATEEKMRRLMELAEEMDRNK